MVVAGVKVVVVDGVFSLEESCCGNCFVLCREPGLVLVGLFLDDDLCRPIQSGLVLAEVGSSF